MFISAGGIYSSLIGSSGVPVVISVKNNSVLKTIPVTKNPSAEVAKLNESLKSSLKTVISGRDTKQSRFLIEKIDQRIRAHDISDSVLSESYYLIGIYHLLTKNFNESIRYLDLCISFKVKENEYDERYARVLYNIGLAYLNLGELKRHEEYSSKSLEIEKKLNGESSPLLASIYLSLGGAYSELQENKKALNYYNNALTIANSKPDSVPPLTKADLFASLGGCYIKLADFSKAKIYLDKAESLYKQFNFKISENYINLMNSLAITYGSLNLTSEAGEYYKKVIPIAIANNSPMAYNIVNSYSVFLANNGEKQKGEELLKDALDRAKARIILFPRSYVEVLSNYASYLRVFRIDNKKSLECYLICLEYLRRNDQDLSLKTSVSVGYSLSLDEEGELDNALEVIQSLLVPEQASGQNKDKYGNPDIEKIKSDGISLKILNTKYKILWDIYKKSDDRRILEIASNTSELIVALLEKVRINISEDDSRLILGDRYRDSYLNAIRDFNLLYNKTNDSHYLEKVFEYSEKSKVEGLLTSTRELNATQLNIPSGIGDYEMKLQVDINLYNARLSDEMASEKPDSALINKWKENLLEVTRSRDSLILIFEQKYPLYYAIKYNTHVAELKDIPGIIGKDGNYVNYILSDSILYTFIANKRYQKLLAIPVDSSFFSDVRKFRSLLSMPLPSDNASLKFNEFQAVGYRLYKILIDPVRSYIISNKIFISPDNILSYLPFETIPTSSDLQNTIMYRNLS